MLAMHCMWHHLFNQKNYLKSIELLIVLKFNYFSYLIEDEEFITKNSSRGRQRPSIDLTPYLFIDILCSWNRL
jgi:hypothetical protein